MIGYASRTGTKRNLDALRRHGWRLMVSATGSWRHEGMPYAIDNGAYTAYQRGEPFDANRFLRCLDKLGHGADWIVVPDIVGNADSLEFSVGWLEKLSGLRVLLAVQDGMAPTQVRVVIPRVFGLFIGGTTAFKEQTARQWGALAIEMGCYLHMGRVNSQRRIRLAATIGCDSFDGTSVSRFAVTIHRLDAARRQRAFLAGELYDTE